MKNELHLQNISLMLSKPIQGFQCNTLKTLDQKYELSTYSSPAPWVTLIHSYALLLLATEELTEHYN